MFLFSKKRSVTNEEKVLAYLKRAISSSRILDNVVYVYKYKLTIEPQIVKIDDKGLAKIIDLSFSIKHELFNEPFVETTTGIGETVEEAFQQSINNFLMGPLYSITNCINDKYDESFETNFFGKKKNWKLFKNSIQGIQEKEEKQNIHIWSVIKEKIKERLGNKRIYWVKVYIARFSNDEINSECHINGMYNSEISEYISECAEILEINEGICMLKQYFVIKQDIETYNKYEFSEEAVKGFTKKVIKALGNCNSKGKYEKAAGDIYKITKNKNLAYEIRKFVPEILCELVFSNINYVDKVTIVKENETESIKCYKNQFTNYYWIYNEVARDYYNHKIAEEEIKTILLLSSSYEIINKTLDDGIKIQDLKNVGIILHTAKEYVPA